MIILTAMAVLGTLSLLLGLVLGYASVRFKVEGNPMVDTIDQLLPQSQCGKCGYPGCRPYAEAIHGSGTEINLCIPGGETTMSALASLLDREPKPVGSEAPGMEKPKMVAAINEAQCIGCTLCIQSCPVDAILGASKLMHTIISQECTGCELCITPCPVECIQMVPVSATVTSWKWPHPIFTLTPRKQMDTATV